MNIEPMSDDDLDAVERRAAAASASPSESFVKGRDQLSGDKLHSHRRVER